MLRAKCGKPTPAWDGGRPCQQPSGHPGLHTTCSCKWKGKMGRHGEGYREWISERDQACTTHGKAAVA